MTMNKWLTTCSLLTSTLLCSSLLLAQISQTNPLLPNQSNGNSQLQNINEQQRTQWRNDNYGDPAQRIASVQPQTIQPFGSQLFQGGFSGHRSEGFNTDYRILPGDQITLRTWGAVEIERILPVDAKGNIFLPGIGPVQVQGMNSNQLNNRIVSAIQAIYPENVQIYTNLQGVQPVSIFVTGYVNKPGRYAGAPHESALYFIDQAGGIDATLGTYRSIRVLRNQQQIAEIDLYDFLLNGQLQHLQFQEGDTIIIDQRGPSLLVTGDVYREYRYEFTSEDIHGQQLIQLARMQHNVTHVLVRGERDTTPASAYYTLEAFAEQPLKNGDVILFSADQRNETLVVQLEGSFYGPSRYALPRDARLHELLDAIPVPKELTDISSISIRRISVAERQKESLRDSLRRLEATYLGASSSTNEEAQIRVQEAQLISQFVQRASQLETTGRLVVAQDGRITDIRLQDGDIITLPEYSDALLISGEVLVPQSVVFKAGMTVLDYIDGAGGFSRHADKSQILVVRQNGEVRHARDVRLKPGDEILVLPKVPTKNLQLAKTLTQMLYQVAIITKVVMDF